MGTADVDPVSLGNVDVLLQLGYEAGLTGSVNCHARGRWGLMIGGTLGRGLKIPLGAV